MKVYEAVANAFIREGTSTLFGLLGGQISWWAAMAKHPELQIVDVREEGAAVAMADGWARVTGRTGVCSVHYGPGLARTITSLIVAARSRTPMVIHTSKTPFNDDAEPQNISQERLVTATGADYMEILDPSCAEAVVRKAFYRARAESRPIVLSLPVSIQDKEIDSEGDDYQPSSVFFNASQRIRPDLARLEEAAGIIAKSRKPVMVLGKGAMSPEAQTYARKVAQRIGALVTTTLIAKGTLGDDEFYAGVSGLYATRTVIQLADEADCVIAVGAGLNIRTLSGGYMYPNAKVVHIDIAPHVLIGTEKVVDCYLHGDAAETLRELEALLGQSNVENQGYRTPLVKKALRDAGRDPDEYEIEPGTVDPREAMRLIDEHLPSNVGLVNGIGHAACFPVVVMKKPRPLQVYVTAFSSIGQVLATAIGVGLGSGQPIVAVEGDGGAMQNIQEMDTAARLGIKLLYVIINDEAYGAEYHRVVTRGLPSRISMVRSPDFGLIAQGCGCRGRTARTLEEVEAGLREFNEGDGPMLLDIRTSRNVVGVPYRRLLYGSDV
jgi:acetolactate synthase-1/2/3 large subunit